MRLVFLISILLVPYITAAQMNEAFIYGKIFDNDTKDPLIGASIVFGSNQGQISDENGYFRIKIPAGKRKLTIQYIGFVSETRNIILSPGDTLEFNIGLNKALNEIEQIVISANKVSQKLSDLTISMSLIKTHFLSNNHITDPQELINKTPGIEVLDGQASIRGGSGFSYGAGSRVLALIDGLPAIAADAGNIKWQFLPLENLSQVEIIKGASSVMYGSSALNGIINFRTAEPGEIPKTKIMTEVGLYDKPSNLTWKWWDTPRMYSTTSLSHLQKVGNTDIGISGNFRVDNGYRRLNDELAGRFNLRMKHYNQKIKGLRYGVNINSGLTKKTDFILWENADNGALKQSETTANELRGKYVTLDPFLTFQKNENTRHDYRMRFQSSTNNFPKDPRTNSNALSVYTEYNLQHKLNEQFKLNIGVSETFSKVLSNFYGNHSTLNMAGFGQLDFAAHEKVKFIAGVRIEENFQDGSPDKAVPIFRSGINYKLANYTFLRTSFGQGYRYPSIAEKYASTSLGSIRIFPNNELRSESGWNSEIGVKQGLLAGKLNGMLDLALFYSQYSDMIEYVFGLYSDPLTDNFEFGFRAGNIEHSKVYGTELELNLNRSLGPFNNTISGGYMYIHPVEYVNSDNFLKYRRKHSATLNITSQYKLFELGVNLYAKSKILRIDNVFINDATREDILPGFYEYWLANNKGYFLSDLTIGYRITQQIKISFAVKNLFNKEYMGRPGDILPHRNFSLRISGIF